MSDDPLLRAIIEDPDDDAPRLVYADWFDEHGDAARAAFIRAQVKLARMPENDPGRPALVQIERTLWRAHRAEWLAWVPKWATVREFHRGFLESVRCDAASFLSGADELRDATPLLSVRLDGPAEIAVPLFRSRVLDGLRSLTLQLVNIPKAAWEHLAVSSYLARLTDLDLSGNSHRKHQLVAALVVSASLPALKALHLRSCTLDDEDAELLSGHPWVARLHVLDLSNNFISDSGGVAILNSRHLHGLAQFNLSRNPVVHSHSIVGALRRQFGERLRL